MCWIVAPTGKIKKETTNRSMFSIEKYFPRTLNRCVHIYILYIHIEYLHMLSLSLFLCFCLLFLLYHSQLLSFFLSFFLAPALYVAFFRLSINLFIRIRSFFPFPSSTYGALAAVILAIKAMLCLHHHQSRIQCNVKERLGRKGVQGKVVTAKLLQEISPSLFGK